MSTEPRHVTPDSSESALYFHTRRVLCPLGLDWQIQTGGLNSYETVIVEETNSILLNRRIKRLDKERLASAIEVPRR